MAQENIKLLTVEETFLIEGRGVLVFPLIRDYRGPMSFPVVLRRPGGDDFIAQAQLDIPRDNKAREPYHFLCALEGITKQDVPVGTEIWISHDRAA